MNVGDAEYKRKLKRFNELAIKKLLHGLVGGERLEHEALNNQLATAELAHQLKKTKEQSK